MYRFLIILSILICSCSTTSNYYSFDNALIAGTEKIQNELPEGVKVAILDFKSDNENLSSYIIEEMYDKLINFGNLSIMERSRTNTIAMEVGYQLSGEVDDKEIVRIGHQLGADYVVTGQIIFSGEAYRLRIFAIDIEKGRRVASSSLNINRNDRQINHLLATQTVSNRQESQNNNLIAGNNDDILSIAIQNLVDNIPNNYRILILGITGANDLRQDHIQEKIVEYLMINQSNTGTIIIQEKERVATIRAMENQHSGNIFVSDEHMIEIGRMTGANMIITGGIFGNRDTRRIVFRAIDIETFQIISSSCVLFNQNSSDFVNDVEALFQRINNGLFNNVRNEAVIVVKNTIGTNRNADFVYDLIENNLVNNSRYRIITMSDHSLDLIMKERNFQHSGFVSEDTMVAINRAWGPQFEINIVFFNNKIQVRINNLARGNVIIQETI